MPPLMKLLARHLVGELDARAAVGRAAGLEPVERGEDRCLAVAGRRRQHQARCAGVDDDRDAVVLAELLDEQLQRRA